MNAADTAAQMAVISLYKSLQQLNREPQIKYKGTCEIQANHRRARDCFIRSQMYRVSKCASQMTAQRCMW